MRLETLHIRNLKFIRDMRISNIGNALILVGRNNTGKSSILKVIRALAGACAFEEEDFNEKGQNIEVEVALRIEEEDLQLFFANGLVSTYRRWEAWRRDFDSKLPSYRDGVLSFTFLANRNGKVRYEDGVKKHNKYIPKVFPKVYFMEAQQDLWQLQEEILMFREDEILNRMRRDCCMFDGAKLCSRCFQCVQVIYKKNVQELNALELSKLLEFKLYQTNLNDFSRRVNDCFRKNGGFAEEIRYRLQYDAKRAFQIKGEVYDARENRVSEMSSLGKGMRRIYMLSLIEAYVEEKNHIPSLILLEDPGTFLHPGLQKSASEILYRLSKKNQVIFTTHSPNMLSNFNSRQIRQIYRDREFYTNVREKTDIDAILNELGHTAGDLLNVNFVFIVEGKQDKSRLPLLLEKYYGELQGPDGRMSRIAIITTNSCTNIKTYANLKYMNKIYLKDQFLMIRDGDGKDAGELAGGLCRYYEERNREDADKLPRVTRKNVLILKYYSFENYFLNPEIMTKIGVVESEAEFYQILYGKWKEYLHRLRSGQRLVEVLGRDLLSEADLKEHMEDVKIHLRGHNLFDIFYGPYREREQELLKRYIDLAPRAEFEDILKHIERFPYFENRMVEGADS